VSETPLIELVSKYARLREDNKTRVKKGARIVGIPKLEDANKAGTKEAALCTLIVTEGANTNVKYVIFFLKKNKNR
jgi:hypothetical protein